jgi:transposase-like protein
MSTKTKKASATGVRYTDAQKQEVVDFVVQYNSQNGRGGQSKAAKKYKVTPLTISAWIKGAGATKAAKPAAKKAVKAPKKAKAVKAPKAVKSSGKIGRGSRYTPEKKQEIIDFVTAYNAKHGRGGQSKAVAKYKLSAITCASWLKAAGVPTGKGLVKKVKAVKTVKKAAKKAAAVSSAPSKAVAKVLGQIRALEAKLAKLTKKK